MEEMAALTPLYRGITYRRLERGGLQWPCPTTQHAGTPILHVKQFSGGKGKFMPLTFRPSDEVADEQYPLLLTTERNLFQYHTGTMTRKVDGINEFHGEERVEINPQDAKAMGLADGDLIRLASRRGALTAKVKVTPASPPGVLCLGFHFAETPTNILTNPALDPVAKIPELKVCAVKTEAGVADNL
jgi:predicted molibdopterin-dependent oxidoreductase YjgC